MTLIPSLSIEFDVIVGEGLRGTLGDCWDRYWVKMQELIQCVRILRQCIKQIPDGAYRAKIPRNLKVPAGEVYAEYDWYADRAQSRLAGL